MDHLNEFYRQLLNAGLLVLRQAVETQDLEWAKAEIEFLHNVPSLMNEANIHRHRYFWESERTQYLQWVASQKKSEVKSRMATFYQPLLLEVEPFMLSYLKTTEQEQVNLQIGNAPGDFHSQSPPGVARG